MLPNFCVGLCVRVCSVCPFACDYINIGLWVIEHSSRSVIEVEEYLV
jgi:hypothetical protein